MNSNGIPNAPDGELITLANQLLGAARDGSADVVRVLLTRADARVDLRPVIDCARREGHHLIVLRLMSHIRDWLNEAARLGEMTTIQQLLENSPKEVLFSDVLESAVTVGNGTLIDALLKVMPEHCELRGAITLALLHEKYEILDTLTASASAGIQNAVALLSAFEENDEKKIEVLLDSPVLDHSLALALAINSAPASVVARLASRQEDLDYSFALGASVFLNDHGATEKILIVLLEKSTRLLAPST